MVGASVHGLLGVDAELQRSALAADQQRMYQHVKYRTFEHDGIRVIAPHERDGECGAPEPSRRQLS